jgi:hypothetical protein
LVDVFQDGSGGAKIELEVLIRVSERGGYSVMTVLAMSE